MDYNLAALKLLCTHLKKALQAISDSKSSFSLGGILFQRAYIQSQQCLLLPPRPPMKLAAASSLMMAPELLDSSFQVIFITAIRKLCTGMYVMVVGGYFIRTGDLPMIKVHKIVDLSACPDREAMWYLGVMEAFKLFYQPSI